MEAMQLPHPRQIDIALPANMVSGKPEEMPVEPDWAPVRMTFAGVPEVEPEWVAENLDKIHMLDVREKDEIVPGEECIVEIQAIPLDELRDRVDEVPKDKPVLAFCRSGRRSSLAVSILNKAGVERAANVAGGYLRLCGEVMPTGR